MDIQEQIQQEISRVLPKMISDAISAHNHNGGDSQTLQGYNLAHAPQAAITPSTTPVSGSAVTVTGTAGATYTSVEQGMINSLKTAVNANSAIPSSFITPINTLIQQVNDLANRLKALGLLK